MRGVLGNVWEKFGKSLALRSTILLQHAHTSLYSGAKGGKIRKAIHREYISTVWGVEHQWEATTALE
jgi:hypothetical protein